MSPSITAIPPPRISAAGWPLSKHASIRTPALTDSGSKITSTPTKKNYASQGRRGLVAWIAARLGRRPTLEEVAAARFAQQQREKRRALRAERRHLQWQRASRDGGKSPDAHVRAILAGPEMAAFWAAAAWLAGTLPGILASARPYDEWATRPETVLRLAESAERQAGRMPRDAAFSPSLRHEAEGVLAYAAWKTSSGPERLVPVESVGLDRSLVAAVNVGTTAAAGRVVADLVRAASDSERRRILAKLRQSGQTAQATWPGIGRLADGPPLGLILDPEPEFESVPSGDGDGPLAGPRPPGGGGGGGPK